MKTQPEFLESVMEKVKAQGVELSEAVVKKVLKAADETRVEDLVETGKTKLTDIGTLETRYRAARPGVNPRTKEEITVPEALTVGLSVSSIIKKEIEEKVDIVPYREAAEAKKAAAEAKKAAK